MSSRKQITTINGFKSQIADVTYGTAQGSILGPLIFILYGNDIFTSLKSYSSMFMYTEDTLLLCQDKDINEVTVKAQKSSNKADKLTINFGKTKYMFVKHVKSVNLNSNLMCNKEISNVSHYEYLGMILDDKLIMNEYLDVVWEKKQMQKLVFCQKSGDSSPPKRPRVYINV